MCNGICKRDYPAKRYGRLSMYIGNVFCSHCETFINASGMYKSKTSWRCKCCKFPVRHTPYGGRKALVHEVTKVIIEGGIPNADG